MSNYKIEIKEGRASVYTPYNQQFVAAIKRLGGAKWDSDAKCWKVPEGAVPSVRKLMVKYYGQSDLPTGEKMLKLKLTIQKEIGEFHGDVIRFGKTLSHAWGRDSGANVGTDVYYLEGQPSSGGSVKNWKSVVKEGCEIVLDNVPQAIFEAQREAFAEYGTVEIMEEESKTKIKALQEERDKLLARIADIDKELAELSK